MTTAETTSSTGAATTAAAAAAGTGASAGTTTPAAGTTTTTTQSTDAAAAAAAATAAAQQAETARIAAAAAKPADIALTLPKDTAITAEHLDQVKAFAKEHGLTQAAAEKALALTNGTVAARLATDAKAFTDLVATWPAEIKADKEIGGEHYDRSIQLRDKVLKSFASEKLVKGFTDSGLINDPEIVRMLVRVGLASSEDTLSGRGTGGGKTLTIAEQQDAAHRAMYPTMFPKAG